MTSKFIATATLVVLLSLSPVSLLAQTPSELLQRGIYLQETAGDLDGAIQVYRQIVASASSQPAVGAQAQFRLTQSLLQKVDFAGVVQEFQAFARKYPDQQSLVDAMGKRLRAIAEQGPSQLLGDFQGGKYHHYWTGVELTAPAGLSFKGQKANPDGFDQVELADPASAATWARVLMTRNVPAESAPAGFFRANINGVPQTPESALHPRPIDIAAMLQERLKSKLNQRGDAAGFHGYAYRPESIQPKTVGGQLALSAVADYKDDKGTPMNEYSTWVQSEKTKAWFSVIAPAADFPGAMTRFEPILSSAVVP